MILRKIYSLVQYLEVGDIFAFLSHDLDAVIRQLNYNNYCLLQIDVPSIHRVVDFTALDAEPSTRPIGTSGKPQKINRNDIYVVYHTQFVTNTLNILFCQQDAIFIKIIIKSILFSMIIQKLISLPENIQSRLFSFLCSIYCSKYIKQMEALSAVEARLNLDRQFRLISPVSQYLLPSNRLWLPELPFTTFVKCRTVEAINLSNTSFSRTPRLLRIAQLPVLMF